MRIAQTLRASRRVQIASVCALLTASFAASACKVQLVDIGEEPYGSTAAQPLGASQPVATDVDPGYAPDSLAPLAFAPTTQYASQSIPVARPFVPEPDHSAVVRRVASMTHDSGLVSRVLRRGLSLVNVTWEDTGRYLGSSVGPNISDFTLQPAFRSIRFTPNSINFIKITKYP